VYRQYVAPIVEYRALLVTAWQEESVVNNKAFTAAVRGFKSLLR
jgi:hypothetical protein